MSRRIVTLQDAQGDEITAVYHPPTMSDLPGTITYNGTTWYDTVWVARGWTITAWGDEEP